MLDEKSFIAILEDIVSKIIEGTIGISEIKERVQNDLEVHDIWESNSLLITCLLYTSIIKRQIIKRKNKDIRMLMS